MNIKVMVGKSGKKAIKSTPKAPRKIERGIASESSGMASKMSFPIVGIGASAGGLEAFTRLLQKLPADTGMAFVLIQHLDPKHDSILASLLARATSMPVHEVTQKMRVTPNNVYVIPRNASMRLMDSTLILTG